MSYCLPLEAAGPALLGRCGRKAATLGAMRAAGFPVPPGFVVTVEGCRRHLEQRGLTELLRRLRSASATEAVALAAQLAEGIVGGALPADLLDAITIAHRELLAREPGDACCAVRSSSTGEDAPGASFAGQHSSYLFVDAPALADMIKACWASMWSRPASLYRTQLGVEAGAGQMAVIVQALVPAEIAGVTFTADPTSGSPARIVTESSWGLGPAIVDGRVSPDRYVVSRDPLRLLEQRVGNKHCMVPPAPSDPAAPRLVDVAPADRRRPTLSPEQALEVARLALAAEAHWGRPQDVEWAIAGGRVHLLQSRPVTTLAPLREVAGRYVLFKAVAENFTEPLTPLTVDLVRCLAFRGLRLIRGWVYVDLDFARRLVPLHLSDHALAELLYLARAPEAPLRIAWRRLPLAAAVLAAAWLAGGVFLERIRRLPDEAMEDFRALARRLEADPAIDPPALLERLWLKPGFLASAGQLVLLINLASTRYFLWLWLLARLLERWLPDWPRTTLSALCAGSDGMRSTDMGRRIAALAQAARAAPAVAGVLGDGPLDSVLDVLRVDPRARDFIEGFEAFMAMHGHRCVREFELASPRWREDPVPVLSMIRNHLIAPVAAALPSATAPRDELLERIAAALEHRPLERRTRIRRRLLGWLAGRVRVLARLRENSRYYHVLAFSAARAKLLAIEHELLAAGRLRSRDDLFYLKWNEVQALRAGRLGARDVEDRIRRRRRERLRLTRIGPPRMLGVDQPRRPEAGRGRVLSGQGASPGVCRGRARVIFDPGADGGLAPGEILVAPYADPAWTPLFVTARAAIVGVGSYLSHAGTIAREYGMPCVVDVAGCTNLIRTGDLVEVDGDSGQVRLLGESG
jgi:pyruvate,water dikinase